LTKNVAGPDQQTVGIESVIQEVVNRSGYNSNSAIAIFIDGYGKRVAESFDGGSDVAPELCVTYSMPTIQGLVSNNGSTTNSSLGQTRGEVGDTDLVIKGLKVYPSPTMGELNVSFKSETVGETLIEIQNMNGTLLPKRVFITSIGRNIIHMSDVDLGSGVYLLRIWTGKKWESRKFVVLK